MTRVRLPKGVTAQDFVDWLNDEPDRKAPSRNSRGMEFCWDPQRVEVIMAFLHCHGCNWSQDDFYSPDGYNPFRECDMVALRRHLFEEEVKLERKTVTGAEFVVMELKRMIARIESMVVMTDEEWQKVRANWSCPRCKSKDWDID